jgi:exonuclease VII small subunit
MKQQMRIVKHLEYCEFCVNGEDTLNSAISLYEKAVQDHKLATS